MKKDLASEVRIKKISGNTDIPNIDVSVITVVYNAIEGKRKDMLLQCLDSVQMQQGLSVEHLIIDGGSVDGTVDLIECYANDSVPIRYLTMRDEGIYDAMNRGMFLAKGKYVTYLNSDDFYHKSDGLAISFKKLEDTKCDYSFAPVSTMGHSWLGNPQLHPWYYIENACFRSIFSHQTMLVNRTLMNEMNGFDLTYRSAADYDFVLRLILSQKRGCFVDYCFVSYRMTGLSSTNIEQSQKETARAILCQYASFLDVKLTEKEALRIHVSSKFPFRYLRFKKKVVQRVIKTIVGLPETPKIKQGFWLDVKYAATCLVTGHWIALRNFLWVNCGKHFSKKWYVIKYGEDLSEYKLPLAVHYIQKGWHEGKDPAPCFSTELYLTDHLDARQKNICPLIHRKLIKYHK